MDTHGTELEFGDEVFDFDGDVVNLGGELALVLDAVFAGQGLRGEAHVHDAGGVTVGGGEVDEPAFAQDIDAALVGENVFVHVIADLAVDLGRFLGQGGQVQLNVEVAAVAHRRPVLHLEEVFPAQDVSVTSDGDKQVAVFGSLSHWLDGKAVHRRFQGADRVDFRDGDDGPQAASTLRHTLAAPAVASDDDVLTGQQHVRGADDAVDGALAGAVAIVEKVLRLRVVDGDDRELQHIVALHCSQTVHAGGRLFHAADDALDERLPFLGGHLRRPLADLGMHVVEPVQSHEDEGGNQVRPVVHRDVRLVFQGGGDVLVIGVVVLAADSEGGDAEVMHEAGSHVVLRTEWIGGDQHHVRPAGLQSAHQVRGFGGDVEAGRHPQTGQRLFLGKPFTDAGQHRHIAVGPQDTLLPLSGQGQVFDMVLGGRHGGGHILSFCVGKSREKHLDFRHIILHDRGNGVPCHMSPPLAHSLLGPFQMQPLPEFSRSPSMSMSRRAFLRDSSLVAAAAAALLPESLTASEVKPAKKVGANDRIRMAVIGFHGRGKDHIKAFASLPDSQITVLCDCDSSLADKGMAQVEKLQGSRPTFAQDLRKVVEDKNIDAVSIATPNHWHVLAALWAVQNGKHVYVEKPLSHNVWEGRHLVEAARKHNRLVQCGTQSRSSTGMREAMDYLHTGKLGKVKTALGLCYKNRPSIGPKMTGVVPTSVDYELWCGPAPLAPVTRKQFHYDWHWFWDYGNGDLGNQGVHEMDKARWGLNKGSLPQAVFSYGGRLGYEDAGETANTQVCHFDYGDCEIIFEVRGHKTEGVRKIKVGNIFYGSEGILVSGNYTSAIVMTPDGEKVKEFKGQETHYANFLQACRTGKHTDLHCDVAEGHLSAALCHLGNISYRQGHFIDGKEAETLFSSSSGTPADFNEAQQATFLRLKAHFADLGLKVQDNFCMGRKLKFDPTAERFINDETANHLLRREYRKGFEVKV